MVSWVEMKGYVCQYLKAENQSHRWLIIIFVQINCVQCISRHQGCIDAGKLVRVKG